MSERRFGVEIEHFMPGDFPASQKILRDGGFPVWANNTSSEYQSHPPRGCGEYGVESRSPILKGAKGFAELKEVMDLLVANGAKVSDGSGMHIHHDAPEFKGNKELCVRLVESWGNNRALIGKFVAMRRRNGGACHPIWGKQYVDRYKESGQMYAGGRGDLNISSLAYRGTIEIRLHEGTLDYYEAEAWIKFGQYFLASVLKRKRPFVCPDEITLLRRTRTPRAATEKLLTKAGVL